MVPNRLIAAMIELHLLLTIVRRCVSFVSSLKDAHNYLFEGWFVASVSSLHFVFGLYTHNYGYPNNNLFMRLDPLTWFRADFFASLFDYNHLVFLFPRFVQYHFL